MVKGSEEIRRMISFIAYVLLMSAKYPSPLRESEWTADGIIEDLADTIDIIKNKQELLDTFINELNYELREGTYLDDHNYMGRLHRLLTEETELKWLIPHLKEQNNGS